MLFHFKFVLLLRYSILTVLLLRYSILTLLLPYSIFTVFCYYVISFFTVFCCYVIPFHFYYVLLLCYSSFMPCTFLESNIYFKRIDYGVRVSLDSALCTNWPWIVSIRSRHFGDLGNVKENGNGQVIASTKDYLVSLLGPFSILGRSVVVSVNAGIAIFF